MARITISENVETNVLTWSFPSGESFTFNIHEVPEPILHRLAMLGAREKIRDGYANAKSVAEQMMNCNRIADNLIAGTWAARGANGGIWVEAVAMVQNISVAEALEVWEKLDKDKQAAIKKHPAAKMAKAKIEQDRAKAEAQSAPKLDELF